MSDIEEELNRQKEIENKRFGLEHTLQQILWNGQVEDVYFNDTFTAVVLLMKKCHEEEGLKKQLYDINLSEYPSEEEE